MQACEGAGCMCVRVRGAGLWGCRCVRARGCGSAGVRECRCVRVRECGVQVWVRMQVCGGAGE